MRNRPQKGGSNVGYREEGTSERSARVSVTVGVERKTHFLALLGLAVKSHSAPVETTPP